MNNPFDNFSATFVQPQQPDFQAIVQQARQNPQAFENFVRQTNPQAYQQALQLRNSGNVQNVVMQMLQNRGINPNVFRMLGII